MYQPDGSPLSTYNSLLDKNLSGYFANTRMRRHLVRSGLITKDGHITNENTYRMNMAKKQHRQQVRDMLANAIVEKALDMERMRQHEIRKKLDELYKIELVQKVRSERGLKTKDDLVAILSPRHKKKKSAKRKARSANTSIHEKDAMRLPDIHMDDRSRNSSYFDNPSISALSDDGMTAVKAYNFHPVPPNERRPQPMVFPAKPHPPPARKKSKKKRKLHRGLALAQSNHLIAHRVQLQSMAEVTMKFLGSSLNLASDMFPSNKLSEVQVVQQHCGGSTICVFRELLPPNTLFTFVSRRHRGSPFGLTINLNGVCNTRISSCCEYKHTPGHKIGGKNSQFALIQVQGASPCYKCQIRLGLSDTQTASIRHEEPSSDEEDAAQSFDVIVSRAGKRPEDTKTKDRPASAHVGTQTSDELVDEEPPIQQEEAKPTFDDHSSDSEDSTESEAEDGDEKLVYNSSGDTSASSSSDEDTASSDAHSDDDEKDKVDGVENKDDGEVKSDKEEQEEILDDKQSESDDSLVHETTDDVAKQSEDDKEEENVNSDDNSSISSKSEKSDSAKSDDEKSQEVDNIDDKQSDQSSTNSSHKSDSEIKSLESEEENKSTEEVEVDASKDTAENSENADSVKAAENEKRLSPLMSSEDKDDDDSDRESTSSKSSDHSSKHSDSSSSSSDDESEQQGKIEEKGSESQEESVKGNESAEESGNEIDMKEEEEEANEEVARITESEPDDNIVENMPSCISRESTMLTGNEDGRCDSENKTIQFNEEVDVVHYEKVEVDQEDVTTPRSDDDTEESDLDIHQVSSNVVLATLDDDITLSGDENDKILSDDDDDVSKKSKDKIVLSDSDDAQLENEDAIFSDASDSKYFDEGHDPDNLGKDSVHTEKKDSLVEERLTRPGSVKDFVEDWRDVDLHDTILSPEQSDEFIHSLEEDGQGVETLSLRNTIIHGGIEKLKDALQSAPNLKALNLSSINMTSADCHHLADIIDGGRHSLETLILHGNPIADEGVNIISKALMKNNTVRILDIGHCQLLNEGARSVAEYLTRDDSSIKELTISSNNFTLEGWRSISDALKTNNTLTVLSVDGNNMGDEACRILCEGIKHNGSLISIDIENNNLSDDIIETFSDAIKQCTTLEDLTLRPNLFSTEGELTIRQLLLDRNKEKNDL